MLSFKNKKVWAIRFILGKEFVRHEFRFTPAKGKVVNIYRETYKCPECAISEEHPDEQTFVKAPVQDPLIPESYASESVVGWAMHQKYQNGLPLNRQESEWTQLGVPLSRATLANWIIYCAPPRIRTSPRAAKFCSVQTSIPISTRSQPRRSPKRASRVPPMRATC